MGFKGILFFVSKSLRGGSSRAHGDGLSLSLSVSVQYASVDVCVRTDV